MVMFELAALSASCVVAYAEMYGKSLEETLDLLASFVVIVDEDEDSAAPSRSDPTASAARTCE